MILMISTSPELINPLRPPQRAGRIRPLAEKSAQEGEFSPKGIAGIILQRLFCFFKLDD
jgi:hypothetical protein